MLGPSRGQKILAVKAGPLLYRALVRSFQNILDVCSVLENSFRTGCGSAEGTHFAVSEIAQTVGNDFVLSAHHSVSLFRPLQVQSLQWFLMNAVQLVDTQPGKGSGGVEFACTFSEGKKKLLLCAHKMRAGTHTHIGICLSGLVKSFLFSCIFQRALSV